jgi:hypothetical protein
MMYISWWVVINVQCVSNGTAIQLKYFDDFYGRASLQLWSPVIPNSNFKKQLKSMTDNRRQAAMSKRQIKKECNLINEEGKAKFDVFEFYVSTVCESAICSCYGHFVVLTAPVFNGQQAQDRPSISLHHYLVLVQLRGPA